MDTALTRQQVRAVDELAVQKYGMCGLVLMENAGRNAAAIIERRFPKAGRAIIFCGTGNNGGDGCVIARHLSNHGWVVRLALTAEESRMSPDTASNFRIVRAMNLDRLDLADQGDRVAACNSVSPDEVVVDALLGTGFRGTVREDLTDLINGINRTTRRAVVAIDVPSGLDCDTGLPGGVAIRADLTITFVANKVGFLQPGADIYTGQIEVADIGAPKRVIQEASELSPG